MNRDVINTGDGIPVNSKKKKKKKRQEVLGISIPILSLTRHG
jgi:hypothetical protein